MSGVIVMVCKKIKTKWDRDLCWNSSRSMDFLPRLRAEIGSFYVEWAISLQWKALSFSFSRFRASITQRLINFTTLESLFSYLLFQKEFDIILLLSAMTERQEGKIRYFERGLSKNPKKVNLIFSFSSSPFLWTRLRKAKEAWI